MLKFNLNHMYFKLFLSSGFLGFARTENPENAGKTENKFDNLLMTTAYMCYRTLQCGEASVRQMRHSIKKNWYSGYSPLL